MGRKGGQRIPFKGMLMRRIRTYLIDVYGEDANTLTKKHLSLAQAIAGKKYGISLRNKTEADKWLKRMLSKGAFNDWPISTKAEVARKGNAKAPVIKEHKPHITDEYRRYIDESLKWVKISDAIIERDGHRCVKCRRNKNLNAHHLTYDHLYHEEKYPGDLITLCQTCHKALHASPDKDKMNQELMGKVSESLTEISLTFTEAELKIAKQRIASIKSRKEATASPSTGKPLPLRRYDNEILNQLYTKIKNCYEDRRNTKGKFNVNAFSVEATQIAIEQIINLLTEMHTKKSISSVRGIIEQYIGEFGQEIKLNK